MNPHRFPIPFHQDRLNPASNVVIFNAPDALESEILGETRVFEQDDAEIYARLHAQGCQVEARLNDVENAERFDRAMIFLSKHSEYNRALFGRAWGMVKEGGDILIEGAKTDGADSLIRGIKALGLRPEVEPKYHGKLAWVSRREAEVGSIKQWIEADDPYQNDAGFWVRPGIFSPKSIDKGTAFLLESLNEPLKGMVADFGGGYGAISQTILQASPDIEALDLYEISYLATECAKQNIQDPRANIHWLDVNDAAREYYNAIISNPPFHKGRQGDPAIGLAFIDAAAKSLRARGSFYMVANRHLPYESRIKTRFGHVEVIAENNAYKIFKATRPNGKSVA